MTRSTGGNASVWWRVLGARPLSDAAPARLPAREGYLAYQEGRYGDAEKLLVGTLKRIERQGPGAPELAGALGDLADLYRVQARYEEAEPLFQRAIALSEARHGGEHTELARPLNSLALVYRAQGQYDRAEPLCRRALAIVERAHGAEHPGTAAALGNLLTVYLAQGRYGEAGPLFLRAVVLKERLLGPRHPSLASSFANYAAFLRKTRSEEEAAAWEARARAIRGKSSER